MLGHSVVGSYFFKGRHTAVEVLGGSE